MNKFYTSSELNGDSLFVRGFDNGERFAYTIPFKPTIYTISQKPTDLTTLDGRYVDAINPGSIKETKKFISSYSDVSGFELFGFTRWQYQWIADEWKNDIVYNFSTLRIGYVDIEVGSEDGFPSIESAASPLTAITVYCDGIYHVFGIGEYSNPDPNVRYHLCTNEKHLIQEFLLVWNKLDLDIVTGWNVKFFDIPYLVRRIENLFDYKEAARMSPWKKLRQNTINIFGKPQQAYYMLGIEILDYIDLYKKFTYVQQESYRLGHIATVELGDKKLDYSEYGSLHNLWKENYQKYLDYNIKDVEILVRLEEKMKLIETAVALAYSMKVNYADSFSQVRMWDVCIHDYLLNVKGIVTPMNEGGEEKADQFVGAYVRDVEPGLYDWVVSFDLNSLYPFLIQQYNISPETLVGVNEKTDVDAFLDKEYDIDKEEKIQSANGSLFKKQQGFLPELMEKFYADRSKFKKQMLVHQQELVDVESEMKKRGLL